MPSTVTSEATVPATGGSSRMASATVSACTSRPNETLNALSTATRSPIMTVGATVEPAMGRVRKAARTGRVIGRPFSASAPAPTVIV